MKKRKWLYLLLIIFCLLVFGAYRAIDRVSTDTEAPKISMNSELLQVSVQDPKSALLRGMSANDSNDGDVTASLVVESMRLLDQDGTIMVTYAAFDSAGNVAKAQREVQYTDYESPKFSLSAPLIFTQNSNFDVLSVIGAQDVIDGDIQHRIRATSLDETSIAMPGSHSVQFRVTNSLGDTVEHILPVEVYPAGTYAAELTLSEYLVYLPVGASFRPEAYLGKFTLNRETTSLEGGLPRNYTLHTAGWVDTQTPGVYSISYTVTYTPENDVRSEYNKTYDGYSKLIVVVEG